MSEMTGRIISHYKILEKHGGDGMGVVHRTEGTKRRRANALKCLTTTSRTFTMRIRGLWRDWSSMLRTEISISSGWPRRFVRVRP